MTKPRERVTSKLQVVTPTRTRREHAAGISAALVKGVESAIEAGLCLAIAQSELDRPEFLAMLRDDLRITEGTASKLKSIASHPVLSQLSHGKALPPNWSVLYALTKVPQTRLLTAIESGEVHPGMQRKDARALKEPTQRDDDLPPNYEGSAEPESGSRDEAGGEAPDTGRFANKLIQLDIELARELLEILAAQHAGRLEADLCERLGGEEADHKTVKPAASAGNGTDPVAAAEAMKTRFAELDENRWSDSDR